MVRSAGCTSGGRHVTLIGMARVLFTSCPAYGHALPMLPLIRAAVRAGHDVRVATGPDLTGSWRLAGCGPRRGTDVGRRLVRPRGGVGRRACPGGAEDAGGAVALFGAPALARLDDLVALASLWWPDIIVHEVLEQAGSMLAGRLGVPSLVHGIGPMFPFYAPFIDAAANAIGEPELWERLSAEQALDLCPPSLQPDGPRPWRDPSRRARRRRGRPADTARR